MYIDVAQRLHKTDHRHIERRLTPLLALCAGEPCKWSARAILAAPAACGFGTSNINTCTVSARASHLTWLESVPCCRCSGCLPIVATAPAMVSGKASTRAMASASNQRSNSHLTSRPNCNCPSCNVPAANQMYIITSKSRTSKRPGMVECKAQAARRILSRSSRYGAGTN